MITTFPTNIHSKLLYYVYLYIDPRDQSVFYVGKGKGNRAFAHLYDTSEHAKSLKIAEIRRNNLEPIIELAVHGIEDVETINRIEASIIDVYGIHNLTNIQRGYHAREFGRMTLEQVVATYAAKEANVTDPVLAFKTNQTFHYGMTVRELYDYTRHSWKLGRRREKAQYAFTVYQDVVQEVFEIKQWLPQNSTPNLKIERGEVDSVISTERWEFVGKVAVESIRQKYIYKNVGSYFLSNQLPFAYINC